MRPHEAELALPVRRASARMRVFDSHSWDGWAGAEHAWVDGRRWDPRIGEVQLIDDGPLLDMCTCEWPKCRNLPVVLIADAAGLTLHATCPGCGDEAWMLLKCDFHLALLVGNTLPPRVTYSGLTQLGFAEH